MPRDQHCQLGQELVMLHRQADRWTLHWQPGRELVMLHWQPCPWTLHCCPWQGLLHCQLC
jgi:hypothetical protein